MLCLSSPYNSGCRLGKLSKQRKNLPVPLKNCAKSDCFHTLYCFLTLLESVWNIFYNSISFGISSLQTHRSIVYTEMFKYNLVL